VLHVIDHTATGGAQVVVGYLLRSLMDQFRFSVAVLGQIGEFSQAYRQLGVPVFESPRWQGRWNPLPFLALPGIIDRQSIDLIHTHLFKAPIVSAVVGKLKRRRVVVHDHTGMYPQSLQHTALKPLVRDLYVRCYRRALGWCDRVLVLTAADLACYSRCYPEVAGKTTVLPNAVDLARYQLSHDAHAPCSVREELGLSSKTRIVLMVGRLDPRKDWLTFLKVAQQVQLESRQPCAFLVVGSGAEEAELRQFVQTHNMGGVFFLGYREDVASLLAQADVFLLTSKREGFGIVLLEAMAAGCPVVATRSGGPDSVITHGMDGLLADVGDVSGLAYHTLALLREAELHARVARQARLTVAKCYSLKAVAARMAGLYREVLQI
jgi:glycosyltransferase involved in cell wall biosynthesis